MCSVYTLKINEGEILINFKNKAAAFSSIQVYHEKILHRLEIEHLKTSFPYLTYYVIHICGV